MIHSDVANTWSAVAASDASAAVTAAAAKPRITSRRYPPFYVRREVSAIAAGGR